MVFGGSANIAFRGRQNAETSTIDKNKFLKEKLLTSVTLSL